jgi:lipopolysaccharide export system permease protein
MLLFWYIVREMIFPFLLTTGIIATILLMDQVFQFIPFLQASGLEIRAVFQMVLYSLSTILMIACPISLMIGVYAGMNRFSSDYELVVIRSAGVSISFLFKPVLFVAGLVAIVVLVLAFYLSPLGVTALEELKFNIVKKHTKIQLSVNRINDFFGQRLVYIFDRQGDQLQGVFIADKVDPALQPVIEAERGTIYFDEERQQIVFDLYDGRIHYDLGETAYRVIAYQSLQYDLIPPQREIGSLPNRYRDPDTGQRRKHDTEMTVNELWGALEQNTVKDAIYFEYSDEFHSRIVTVLSCLCFAIFALPMGIFDPRSPKAGSVVFMTAVLLLYFLIFAQARNLLTQGRTHPIALYLPLFLALLMGFFNYFKINHDVDSPRRWLFGHLRTQLQRFVTQSEHRP